MRHAKKILGGAVVVATASAVVFGTGVASAAATGTVTASGNTVTGTVTGVTPNSLCGMNAHNTDPHGTDFAAIEANADSSGNVTLTATGNDGSYTVDLLCIDSVSGDTVYLVQNQAVTLPASDTGSLGSGSLGSGSLGSGSLSGILGSLGM